MMATERGATRSTLSAYESDLLDFQGFIKNKREVESVTSEDINFYLHTKKHFSSSTVARRLSALRQFYSFLLKKGKIKENPTNFIKLPSQKQEPISFLKKEEVVSLLEGAKIGEGSEGKRLFALLQLLYALEISVKDLVALPLEKGLDILGSSSEGRKIFLPAQEALKEYLKVRDCFLLHEKESPWLFPSSSKKGHLTRQRFGQLLKELSLRVGLNPARSSLYIIRQGFYSFNEL